MKIPFEQLDVWKKSCQLVIEVYKIFDQSQDYRLRNQITRAAVSVPSNIAEGSERQTTKEFIQYLYIAKGFVAELRNQVYIAGKLKQIFSEDMQKVISEAKKVSKMLQALISSLKN